MVSIKRHTHIWLRLGKQGDANFSPLTIFLVSAVFAYNTNVQVGEPCHMYYICNYTSKNTQKEDSERFIIIGTQVYRRLYRMRTTALENSEMENDTESTTNADFSEGISRMLSGMCANMSEAVCSSPMAHLIVSNDRSIFEFSHSFINLLVSQAVDVLEGKESEFWIRTNFSKAKNEKVFWTDSSLDNY